MHATDTDLEELRRQLAKGSIQKAYRALLSYMLGLRAHFLKGCPGFTVSGLYRDTWI